MLRRYALLSLMFLCTTLAVHAQKKGKKVEAPVDTTVPPPPPPPPPPGLMLFAKDAQLSPDGSKLVVFGSDRLLRILSVPGGEQLGLITPTRGVFQNAVYFDDTSLVTLSELGVLQIWSERGEELTTVSSETPIRMFVVSNDRKRVLAADGGNYLIRLPDKGIHHPVHMDDKVLSLSFSQDGRRFLVRTADHYTFVYDFDSTQLLFRMRGLEKENP